MIPKLPIEVEQNIHHFTGRTWLLPRLVNWLKQTDERMLILTGEPGTGKSMTTAWLAGAGPLPAGTEARTQLEQIRSLAKAAHFCISGSGGSRSPGNFTETVANQLTENVPGFGDALSATLKNQVQISVTQQVATAEVGSHVTGIYIERLDLGGLDEESSFDHVFRKPFRRLCADGYSDLILILVDALDEATINLVQLLTKLDDLPQNVRFLVTTRSDPRILKFYSKVKTYDLTTDAPKDVDDVYLYAYERLATLDSKSRKRFALKIAQAANGVFLYAYLVLSDVYSRLPDISDLSITSLPQGLSGLYHDFLNRELGTNEDRWHHTFKPLLGLIGVAQGEGLSRMQIEQIIGQEMEHPLRICKQYLSGLLPDGPFRLFHKSFADFLLIDRENLDYHIDAKGMHRRIAEYSLKIFNRLCGNTVVDYEDYSSQERQYSFYFFKHGAQHFIEANMKQDLWAIMGNRNWWRKKLEVTSPFDLIADIHLINQPEASRIYNAFLEAFRNTKDESFWSKLRQSLSYFYGPYSTWPSGLCAEFEKSDDTYTQLFLGNTFNMEEKYEEAISQFRKILEKAAVENDSVFESHASVRLATVLNHLGRHSEALDTIDRHVGREDARERYGNGYWWMQYHRAILLRALNRFGDAQMTFKMVQNNTRTDRLKLEAHHQIGVIYLELDELERAKECFEQCLLERKQKGKADHRQAYDYRRIAQVFALSGDFRKARQNFRKAVEISNDYDNARYARLATRELDLFVNVPLYLKKRKPKTINLIELLTRFPSLIDQDSDNENIATYFKSTFQVLAKQKLYYLEEIEPGSGKSTKKCVAWETIHTKGIWHRTVSIIVLDESNLVVLQKRVEKDSQGRWDLSVTGHVDVGETDEEAALRETWEELGFLLSSDQLRRIGEPYAFHKRGDPNLESDEYINPRLFQYFTNKKNYECVSIFVAKITRDQWNSRTRDNSSVNDSGIIRCELEDIALQVGKDPVAYASGVKQILHPEIIQDIHNTIRSMESYR